MVQDLRFKGCEAEDPTTSKARSSGSGAKSRACALIGCRIEA